MMNMLDNVDSLEMRDRVNIVDKVVMVCNVDIDILDMLDMVIKIDFVNSAEIVRQLRLKLPSVF